jgi:hypothetical protein
MWQRLMRHLFRRYEHNPEPLTLAGGVVKIGLTRCRRCGYVERSR